MKAYVWDLPTRLFHWLLVVCVVAAFVTAKMGGAMMVWHGRIGLTIVGLLVFRLVWGVIGSTHARFGQFVRGPAAVLAYLRGAPEGLGHNPLGALSVLALLGALAAMAGTGLFANDDIAFRGYLAPLVSSDMSNRLTAIHFQIETLLMALVGLHLAAILFYAFAKKRDLVRPMLTGWAPGDPGQSTKGGGPLAFAIAVIVALAAVWAASGALNPPPPPPPASTGAPNW